MMSHDDKLAYLNFIQFVLPERSVHARMV